MLKCFIGNAIADNEFYPSQPTIHGTIVILDDPECVSSESCSPAVPKNESAFSTQYFASLTEWLLE